MFGASALCLMGDVVGGRRGDLEISFVGVGRWLWWGGGGGRGDIVSLFLYSFEIPKLFVGTVSLGEYTVHNCLDVSDSYLDTFLWAECIR